MVGVTNVQGFARRSGVTGDAARINRQGELVEGHGLAVALGQLEDQALGAFARFLRQVKRPGVGGGDLAALGQNEFQQGVGVAFGRKRHADAVERLEFRIHQVQLAADLLVALRGLERLESPLNRHLHQLRRGAARQRGEQPPVLDPPGPREAGCAHQAHHPPQAVRGRARLQLPEVAFPGIGDEDRRTMPRRVVFSGAVERNHWVAAGKLLHHISHFRRAEIIKRPRHEFSWVRAGRVRRSGSPLYLRSAGEPGVS